MFNEENLEVKKAELINSLNDKSNYLVYFSAYTGDEYYEITFKRVPVSVMGYFSKFIMPKFDILQKLDNSQSMIDYTFSMPKGNNANDMLGIVPYTIERMVDEIINPATFVNILDVRKGVDELNYRKSIINAMLDDKTKEIEILVTYPPNGFYDEAHYYKAFKTNDGWKAEYHGYTTDVIVWAIAKEIMDFNNSVWMTKCL